MVVRATRVQIDEFDVKSSSGRENISSKTGEKSRPQGFNNYLKLC